MLASVTPTVSGLWGRQARRFVRGLVPGRDADLGPGHAACPGGRGDARARLAGIREDRGVITLEWVVIFPVLLLLIFGTVQAALHYHAGNVASGAASEGVHAGTVAQGSAARARAAAEQFIEDAGDGMFTSSSIEVSRTATTVTVTVRGRSLSVVPGLSLPEIRQVVSGPIEQPPV